MATQGCQGWWDHVKGCVAAGTGIKTVVKDAAKGKARRRKKSKRLSVARARTYKRRKAVKRKTTTRRRKSQK